MRLIPCLLLSGGGLLVASCTGDIGPGTGADAGPANTATGGSGNTGGDTSAAGGSNGGSGGPSSGGAAEAGGTAGTAASGGAGTAGLGGSNGSGGVGSDAGPRKSAGCGTANPPQGALTISVQAQDAMYVLSLPSNYDPNRAYPVGFAFHGRGRTGPECQAGDCIGFQTVMKGEAVLVYMTALGGALGWEGSTEREPNVAFFQALVADLKSSYCIDEDRIFVAGTSSGATFVNVLGCRFGDKLLAVAPVAGGLPEKTGCVGEVAALVIHGVDDSHVPFASGEEARDSYLSRDHCSATSVPPVSELHPRVVANRESHECASYTGCDPHKSVMWCEHSEGGYDGSTHGWPKFAGQSVWDFVQSLN